MKSSKDIHHLITSKIHVYSGQKRMKKSVLIISLSDLKTDMRVRRQVNFYKDRFQSVTVAAYGGVEKSMGVHYIRVNPHISWFTKLVSAILLLDGQYDRAYHFLYGKKVKLNQNFDLIVANDIEALPIAIRYKNEKIKVLFDAHEYAPRHFEDKWIWRFFIQGLNLHLCKKYIPQVDLMTTVGEMLAKEYDKHYGVLPTVIINAPPYADYKPKPVKLPIRMVHHGTVNRARGLEVMIEMMKLLDDRFRLDLILLPPRSREQSYLRKLKKMLAHDSRIQLLPSLPGNQVVPTISHYDLGIINIPPRNFNYRNCLPNKLFEYIQGRVALAVGPTPEIKKIVENYRIGVVSEDFTATSLAEKIKNLTTQQIFEYKERTTSAAMEFNVEQNYIRLTKLMEKIFPLIDDE